MNIGGISNTGYPALFNTPVNENESDNQKIIPGMNPTATTAVDGSKGAKESKEVRQAECQTCKQRKYVDGSDEGDVSFKAPAHIDPSQSAGVVMGHEQEHVANAIAEGNQENKELLSVSVTLHTAVCPECGRVYVDGGNTHTVMKTTKENGGNENTNPYAKQQAKFNYIKKAGVNFGADT